MTLLIFIRYVLRNPICGMQQFYKRVTKTLHRSPGRRSHGRDSREAEYSKSKEEEGFNESKAMNEREGVCLKRVRASGSERKSSALQDYQKRIGKNKEYQENKRIAENLLVLLTASSS